jgi:hypothetical protein
MSLPQNSSVTTHGLKWKYGSLCSIFHKLSEYSNFEITFWGKQGLLVVQMTTGNSFTDFRQKSVGFAPKWAPKMHKPYLSHMSWIFMVCIMRKCVIMFLKYSVWCFYYAIFPIFSDFSIKSCYFTQNLLKAPTARV